jgi:hypothetical protein
MNPKSRTRIYNKHTESSKNKISRKAAIEMNKSKPPRSVVHVSIQKAPTRKAPMEKIRMGGKPKTKTKTKTKTNKEPSKLNIVPNIQFKLLPPKAYPLSPKLPTIIEESNESCELEILFDTHTTFKPNKPNGFFQKPVQTIERCVELSSKLTEEIIVLTDENLYLKEIVEQLKTELKKIKHVKTNQSI